MSGLHGGPLTHALDVLSVPCLADPFLFFLTEAFPDVVILERSPYAVIHLTFFFSFSALTTCVIMYLFVCFFNIS